MSMELTKQIVLVIEYDVPEANRARFLELIAQSCRDTVANEGSSTKSNTSTYSGFSTCISHTFTNKGSRP